MQAALKKAEELKARKLQQLEQYTNDIIEFGLWQSKKVVDEELESPTLGTGLESRAYHRKSFEQVS